MSAEAREGACEFLVSARAWLVWAQGAFDTMAVEVAGVQLLLAQAWFVSTRETSTEHELFPQPELIRRYLQWTGADEWLRSYDVELPDWLD